MVPLSEPSVASPSRRRTATAAFAGAREIIDQIKAQAPIWKQEEGDVGATERSRAELRALPAVHELAAQLDGAARAGRRGRAASDRRAAALS